MESGKIFLGVLAGVAAGALVGVLFAPAKGSDTRKKIIKKGEEFKDDLKEKFDDLIENVSKKFHKANGEVNDTSHAKAKPQGA